MYSKLEFKLEFITPAFIGGAFNQEKEYLELRSASLIGSLRYWFRNLLGTITDDVDAIYKLEEELFGSQQKAGAVKVRVKPEEVKINDNFDHLGEEEKEALSYIGFGNIIKRENKRTKEVFYSVRPYLDIGSKYKITFLVPKKYEDLFVSFLYLYNFLGSLGGRSRRGWGNFILKPTGRSKEKFNKNLEWEVFNKKSLEGRYRRFTNKAKEFLENLKEDKEIINFNPLWKFEIFEPNRRRFLNNSVESILIELSKTYKRFRFRRPPDYSKFYEFLKWIDEVLKNAFENDLNNNQIKEHLENTPRNSENIIYNRIWLGLPINNISYKDLNYVKGNIVIDTGRLASPVIFRLIPVDGNQYNLLVLVKYYLWKKTVERENKQPKESYEATFFNKDKGFWCIPKISFNEKNQCLNLVKAKINVSQKGLKGKLNNILKSISKQVVTNQSFEEYMKIFLKEAFEIEIDKNNSILTLGG